MLVQEIENLVAFVSTQPVGSSDTGSGTVARSWQLLN
jgi:hypothetical protein